MSKSVFIIGGGAAGFFAAIQIAQINPALSVTILERGKDVLTKVKVSGGGRCNVTHAEFIPDELVKFYPRGEKELRGPFHQFCSGDTVAFFEDRGVPLKIEEDGRMFPTSDSSQSIIDCFLKEVKRLNIQVLINHSVKAITKLQDGYSLDTSKGNFVADKLLICTGSNPKIWNLLKELGHAIVPPVPSLFTFNIKDARIEGLAGVATNASILIDKQLFSNGPLLITHWGLSGPAVLKLSAWGAIKLHKLEYNFEIQVNWLDNQSTEDALVQLKKLKQQHAKQNLTSFAQFNLPKRLWHRLLESVGLAYDVRWADLTKNQLQNLALQLTQSVFKVKGKSTFKDEFVTAGGVTLKEVNFKTYESKLHNNLYFAGEVLNIDAITGGYNFQNAWTGAYIAAKAIAAEK
jgi:hypothetical protein